MTEGIRIDAIQEPAALRAQLDRCWRVLGTTNDTLQLDNLMFLISELQRRLERVGMCADHPSAGIWRQ